MKAILMMFNRGPYDANAPAGERSYRRRSPWGWAIGSLMAVLGIMALFAWLAPTDEPVATGAVAPPAIAVPPAETPPVTPPVRP